MKIIVFLRNVSVEQVDHIDLYSLKPSPLQ